MEPAGLTWPTVMSRLADSPSSLGQQPWVSSRAAAPRARFAGHGHRDPGLSGGCARETWIRTPGSDPEAAPQEPASAQALVSIKMEARLAPRPARLAAAAGRRACSLQVQPLGAAWSSERRGGCAGTSGFYLVRGTLGSLGSSYKLLPRRVVSWIDPLLQTLPRGLRG